MPTPVSIGLDIGSVYARAVEITAGRGDRPEIANFGQERLPDGAMSGGVVKDDKAVTSTVRHLWSAHQFRTKTVRLAVTHPQVVVREVELANLPPKEMRQTLPFQAREVTPLPVDQAVLDFYPLEKPSAEKGKKRETVRGLLVAAPKEAVLETVHAVERAGLFVERVDLACFAVLRAIAAHTSGSEAIIDIGAKDTLIVIHSEGVPQIVRTISRGGDEVTKFLSKRLGVTEPEAEERKCRIGLLGSGYEGDAETMSTVEEAVRPLINEIRSSITYFVNGGPHRSVTRLALVGGASQLPGLAHQLGKALGVEAISADPLQYFAEQRRGRHDVLGQFRSSAAVSIGLTLGAAS